MNIKRYLPLITLFILLFIAFFLRTPMFIHRDFYLLPDQGRDLQLVKSIVADHKVALIGGHAGFGGLFHGPLWLYMIAPFFFISRGDPFWSLIPVYLIVSLGLIIAGYIFTRKLYGQMAGILIATLLTFSSTYIGTISFTSNSQVMPLIFLLYLYTIIRFLRGNDKWIMISLFLIGIGIHFESAFSVMLFPITLSAIIFRRKLPNLKILVIGSFLFLISVSNFLLFEVRHSFLMSHSIFNLLTGHFVHSKSDALFSNLFIRLQDRIFWFIVTFKSIVFNPENMLVSISLLLIFGVSFVLLIKSANKQTQENKEVIFIAGIIFLSFILYMFFPLGLQEHYIQSLSIAAILLLVISMKNLIVSKPGLMLVVLFLLLSITPAVFRLVHIMSDKARYVSSSEGTYINQLRAVDYVFKNSHGKPFGYFVYDAPIVTYGIDYLMWWRGKTKYHYIPESKKLPVTYLIMLPGPAGDLHAHEFWEKYTVKTNGKVLDDVMIPGNIAVKKIAIDPKEVPVDVNYYQNLIFR